MFNVAFMPYFLRGYVESLQPSVYPFHLINARYDEEETRTLFLASLDTTKSKDNSTLVLRDHFDHDKETKGKRE